jgi:hypothetical protein
MKSAAALTANLSLKTVEAESPESLLQRRGSSVSVQTTEGHVNEALFLNV